MLEISARAVTERLHRNDTAVTIEIRTKTTKTMPCTMPGTATASVYPRTHLKNIATNSAAQVIASSTATNRKRLAGVDRSKNCLI